jgi:hypothetical protein
MEIRVSRFTDSAHTITRLKAGRFLKNHKRLKALHPAKKNLAWASGGVRIAGMEDHDQ